MATDVEKLVVQLSADIKQFQRGMDAAKGVADRQARAIEQRFRALNKTASSSLAGIGRLASGPLAALGAALSVREVVQFSDAWTRANNSLKVAGLSGGELTSVMGQLYSAAQRQGVPLEALTTLYGRAAQSATELGATSKDLIQFSDDVASALRIAGTSPEQASGALLQLSQLLGSARVQAEEFNSINEGARPILQAVANGIEEAGGSVSKLKTLVTDGAISNVAFFKGFQAGAAGLREQAATATDTIAQAFTRVSNALTKSVGELSQTSGASQNAVTNLNAVADAIGAIPAVVDRAANKLGELRKALSEAGNSPFWERVGRLMGVQYTPEEAAKYGLTMGDPRAQGIAALKAGKGTALSQDSGMLGEKPAAKTVKASDYPVVGAKEKKNGRDRVNDFDREVAALQRRTDAMRLDTEMVGRSTYETEKARAAQELLNAAKQQYGENIGPEIRARIDEEASAYGRVAEASEAALEASREWIGVQQQLGDFLADKIASVAAGYQDFNDVLQNGIGLLTQMALKAALLGEGPLGGLLGSKATSSGPGGLIGALFGGFRANGGPVSPGKAYVVGEKRPEVFVPRQAGTIVPRVPTLPEIRGSGGTTVSISPTYNINAPGGSQLTEAGLRAILEQNNRQLMAQVPGVVDRARARIPRGKRV